MPRLGALQKGTPDLQEFTASNFAGGLNVRGFRSPQLLADNDLSDAYNGYLTTGGFLMRNGLSSYQSAIGGTGAVKGLARFYQQVKNGAAVSVKATLAQVGDTLYNADTPASIGSIGTSTQPMTWVRVTDPNDPNFISGNTDVIVICTGSGGPYVYDGTNLYTPAGWASAAGAQYCALVNGVVFFAGMGTAPRTILGTGDGTTNNSFESLDATAVFNVSNPVTALCSLGTGAPSALCVGTTNGLTVVYGTGTANYQQQDIPFFYDGPVSGRAMIYEAGTVYFLGRQAVYAFDGQNAPVQISIKVEPWIQNDGYTPGYPLAGDVTKAFLSVYKNRLHLGYINGSTMDTFLVYDLLIQGWTVLQTTPGVYSMCLLDAPGDSGAAVVGSSAGPAALNWDVEPAIGSNVTDNGTAITARVRTKFFKIGVPGTAKVLTRSYAELQTNGNISGSQSIYTDYNTTAAATNTFSQTSASQGSIVGLSARQDWSLQGDAFAFGVQTTGSSAPWTLNAITATFSQQGRP